MSISIAKRTTLALAASVLFLAGQASADPWNKKTYVTFPNMVELPGRVLLPPGTYTMKLVDSSSNRFIVQVSNRDENRVFATFHTIPQYRDRPVDKTLITFYETPGSAPRFIHTWYYPGDTTGREFFYGKERAAYIATLRGSQSSQTVVASTETNRTQETARLEEELMVSDDLDRSAGGGDQKAKAETPITDAEMPDQQPEPAPAPAQVEPAPPTPSAEDQQPAAAPAPTTLPKTASELPFVAVSGVILLGLGTLLRRVH